MARCADYVREVWDTTYHQSVTYRRYCMSVHRCQDLGMNLMVEAKGGMNTSYIYTVPISIHPLATAFLQVTGDKGALCLPCYSIKRPHGWLDIFGDVWRLSRESIPPNVWQILWSNWILEIPTASLLRQVAAGSPQKIACQVVFLGLGSNIAQTVGWCTAGYVNRIIMNHSKAQGTASWKTDIGSLHQTALTTLTFFA